MRILMLTSCTNRKAVGHPRALTVADFARGADWVRVREDELAAIARPAEELYAGEQHRRLMRGVRQLRGCGVHVDVRILSAGYGLLAGERRVVPYEATFGGLRLAVLRQRADVLKVPEAVRSLLGEPFDLGLLLLGGAYLRACALDCGVSLGGPVLAMCGKAGVRWLPASPRLRCWVLTAQDAGRFHCGQVGLKGEIARCLLSRLAAQPEFLRNIGDEGCDLAAWLAPTPDFQ